MIFAMMPVLQGRFRYSLNGFITGFAAPCTPASATTSSTRTPTSFTAGATPTSPTLITICIVGSTVVAVKRGRSRCSRGRGSYYSMIAIEFFSVQLFLLVLLLNQSVVPQRILHRAEDEQEFPRRLSSSPLTTTLSKIHQVTLSESVLP